MRSLSSQSLTHSHSQSLTHSPKLLRILTVTNDDDEDDDDDDDDDNDDNDDDESGGGDDDDDNSFLCPTDERCRLSVVVDRLSLLRYVAVAQWRIGRIRNRRRHDKRLVQAGRRTT